MNAALIRPISTLLSDLAAGIHGEHTSIDELLLALHERGFGFILLVFAVPMALPIPVPPGINVLLASPLILLTAQQALGRHTIWLPQGMRGRSLSSAKLRKILEATIPWMKRLEYIVRPRLGWMTQGLASNLIGLCGLLMALSVAVPIPLSNTVPSFGIALMAIGVLMRDGLAVLAGALIGLTWVALLFGLLIFVGAEGIDLFKETVRGLLAP